MPAYFSLSLEFSRKEISADFMRNFHNVLELAGLPFKSGYWHSEREDLQKILAWNQKKLEQDFKLGYDENGAHDYRQMLFRSDDFSEVRGFWLNRYPVREEFTFEIIIPESELFSGEFFFGNVCIPKKMQIIREIACKLWESVPVLTIQTEPEIADETASYQEILTGQKLPNACPFAIVSEQVAQKHDFVQFQKIKIGRNGILLEYQEDKTDYET